MFIFVSTHKIEQLPEFFKFSFRHVSFIQPDTELILESLLLAFGFQKHMQLARYIHKAYTFLLHTIAELE